LGLTKNRPGSRQCLGQATDSNGKSGLVYLRERRPDIEQLELDCDNSDNVLPYIDLVRNQNGPVAIIVGNPDPLVAIGIFISKEWYGPSIPLIQFPTDELMKVLKDGDMIEILEDGTIQKAQEVSGVRCQPALASGS